jgi:hypothetical protein
MLFMALYEDYPLPEPVIWAWVLTAVIFEVFVLVLKVWEKSLSQ